MGINKAAVIASALMTCTVVGIVAVSLAAPPSAPDPAATTHEAVMRHLPGLVPADGEPTLPGLADAAPAAGTVGRVDGPFDARIDLATDAFDGRAVSGTVTVTSDVSDILELEVLAGFYDASGRLLGSATWVAEASDHHGTESGGTAADQAGAPPVETVRFSVEVPSGLAAGCGHRRARSPDARCAPRALQCWRR